MCLRPQEVVSGHVPLMPPTTSPRDTATKEKKKRNTLVLVMGSTSLARAIPAAILLARGSGSPPNCSHDEDHTTSPQEGSKEKREGNTWCTTLASSSSGHAETTSCAVRASPSCRLPMRMSSGPSCLKEKPRCAWSSCMLDTPRSKSTAAAQQRCCSCSFSTAPKLLPSSTWARPAGSNVAARRMSTQSSRSMPSTRLAGSEPEREGE